VQNGTVKAEVNHGRWIITCPTAGCGGAVVACKADMVFMCPYCANRDNNGSWYRVVFPRDKAQIEAQLIKRPDARKRNWEIGETVTDLANENKARGIG